MQDADAARRLAILRGETPPPLPEPEEPADPSDRKHARRGRDGGTWGGQRKKRKRAGEDDTDFEMRVARERAEEGARVADELGPKRQKLEGEKREEANIVDNRGHIDLVGPPPKDAGGGGGDEVKKTQELADKRMKSFGTEDFTAKPWYEDEKRRHAADRESCFDREAERCVEAPTTNVWGRDDSKRRGRETARLDASDPLAAMKSGAKKVRDIQKERRGEAEERRRELEQLRQEERRREKRRKREHERADDEDERRRERRRRRGHERADEGQDEDENGDRPLQESHRSGRSERSHHDGERHEGRRAHVHRDDRPRPRENERARDQGSGRHHERRRERSRERGSSSRSHHRDKDRDHRRHDRRREN